MGPNRCQSWILGLSGAIHTQTTVMDYLRQKIDSLTPTDTQDFESKLEKSHVFRMKGRQHGVILIKKQTTFIPQRRVLLKELTEWVPLVECSHYLVLSPKGEFLRTPRGVPLFGNAFSCLFRKSIFSPPTTHSKSTSLLGGWLVGWVGVLPFGTLDHVRTIFFKFLVF